VLAKERQGVILDRVRDRGAVRVSELTGEFGVSEMTIRRDLDQLARRGLVDKVHGGAVLPGRSSTDEPGFEAKSGRDTREKEAIARLAATLVRPGTAVGLSAGTTTWTLAHQLREIPGITVVTDSYQTADLFYRARRVDQTVILTGGERTPSGALVGPLAVAALRSLNLDLVFLGAHGMEERRGFSTPNLLEAETNRAFVASAGRIAIVADHTKWGVTGISTFAQLRDADTVVSDTGLPATARDTLAAAGIEVLLADV
jgi:DeoR/GlpR family transcriptional regulator of sugar metabolism